MEYISRRSPVFSLRGCVASSQPLATRIGTQILEAGGNAADAAVAVAAALSVTEPCSTGIGGDCFCLFYNASTKTVKGLNGTGRAPAELSLESIHKLGYGIGGRALPARHALNVTVPGAAAGWIDTVEEFGSGKLSLREILHPAIDLAETGFPVSTITAHFWKEGSESFFLDGNPHGKSMLIRGHSPRAGEVIKLPDMARTFRTLIDEGKAGFYKGRIANAIADVVTKNGGVLNSADLAEHETTFDDPIAVNYKGIEVWEMPPNGQGIAALMGLNLLKEMNVSALEHNSPEYLNVLIQAMQLSFADARWYCADPRRVSVPVRRLLSDQYASERRSLIRPRGILDVCRRGEPCSGSNTVQFAIVDSTGNACSFINSNYMGFGTGLVPEGCGFTLQNRGSNFDLDPTHPNCVAPRKRPYHTIIPGMATIAETSELYACFGVMGCFMQPQGHVQVLLNMIDFGMDPQLALDAPRFCILQDDVGGVALEDGIAPETASALKAFGHAHVVGSVRGYDRALFGRGQIIRRERDDSGTTVYCAGSDGRADGAAMAALV